MRQVYGSKDYPGTFVTLFFPKEVSPPACIEVRLKDRDFVPATLWWHYDENGDDVRRIGR